MIKMSHMKTKFCPPQSYHRSPTELAAAKFTCSQSRTSPVAARCECDCVIETTLPKGPNEDINPLYRVKSSFLY